MKQAIGLPATPPVSRAQVHQDVGVVLLCSRRVRGGAHCVALSCSTQARGVRPHICMFMAPARRSEAVLR
jgi:hypothetical protein